MSVLHDKLVTYNGEFYHLCDSSFIDAVRYDTWSKQLKIILKNNLNRIYVYRDVPRYVWDDIYSCASVGQYYNRNIRYGKFPVSIEEVQKETLVASAAKTLKTADYVPPTNKIITFQLDHKEIDTIANAVVAKLLTRLKNI